MGNLNVTTAHSGHDDRTWDSCASASTTSEVTSWPWDGPFVANETFTCKPKPAMREAEYAVEVALAQSHRVVPHNEGIGETRVKDVWNCDDLTCLLTGKLESKTTIPG